MIGRIAGATVMIWANVAVASFGNQAGSPAMEWYRADGEPAGGFSVGRTRLAETHLTPRARSGQKPATLSDGRVATGVGLNAWFDGTRVHVTTVLVIPRDPTIKLAPGEPAPPGFYTHALLARFTLAVGEARRLDEMKKLGWAPLTVRIHPPGFKH